MLLSVHAIGGSASAPTAEHQRRRPRMAGDRAGKQNRQFIGALVERFRHFSDLFLHLVALHGRKTRPSLFFYLLLIIFISLISLPHFPLIFILISFVNIILYLFQ